LVKVKLPNGQWQFYKGEQGHERKVGGRRRHALPPAALPLAAAPAASFTAIVPVDRETAQPAASTALVPGGAPLDVPPAVIVLAQNAKLRAELAAVNGKLPEEDRVSVPSDALTAAQMYLKAVLKLASERAEVDVSQGEDDEGGVDAESAILEAYKTVIVPRPLESASGLGVSMAAAIAALHARRGGETHSMVLLHVCRGDEGTYDRLITGGRTLTTLPETRTALTALHSRAYPGRSTWQNYKSTPDKPVHNTPHTTDASGKKQFLKNWACRDFVVAA